MAQCFHRKGFVDLARKEYERSLEGILEIDERAKEMLYSLGSIAEAEGNAQEARSLLRARVRSGHRLPGRGRQDGAIQAMTHSKQAAKRVRLNLAQRERNKSKRTAMRGAEKKVRQAAGADQATAR